MEALTAIGLDLLLLETVAKGTLLLAVACGFALALRRSPAALRHGVWSAAFAALLLLPLGAAFLPELRIALPVPGPDAPAKAVEIKAETPVQALAQTPRLLERAARAAVREAAPVFAAPAADQAPGPPAMNKMALLFIAWAAGALVLLGMLGVTLARLGRTARTARPVTDPEWTEMAEIVCARLSIVRPVRLLQTSAVAVPMTYGVRRPVVLLPADAVTWPESQREVVLLHELLHVKRNDFLMHLVAQVARALHWFNPLAWYASRRLLDERERACDDGVLALGVTSSHYADHLLDMAKSILTGREASTAALAMARPSELRRRIAAILDPAQRRQGLTRSHALTMAGLMILLVLPLAAARPTAHAAPFQAKPAVKPRVTATVPQIEASRAADAGDVLEEIEDLEGLSALSGLQALEGLDALGALGSLEGLEGLDALGTLGGIIVNNGGVQDTTEDEAFQTQKKAVFALSQLPREQAVPRLAEIARTHRNAAIRGEALFWLGQTGGTQAADLLEQFARNDANVEVQKKAIFGLSQLDDEAGVPRLIDLARTHPNAQMRGEAIFWVGQQGGPDVVDELEQFARNDDSPELQKKAIFALGQVEDGAGLPRLANLARNHPNVNLRAEAIFWLGQEGDSGSADMLEEFARNDASTDVQKKAIFAIGQLDDNAGVPVLIDLARTHRNMQMRSEAVFWLGQSEDPRAAEVLMEIANGQ